MKVQWIFRVARSVNGDFKVDSHYKNGEVSFIPHVGMSISFSDELSMEVASVTWDVRTGELLVYGDDEYGTDVGALAEAYHDAGFTLR